MYGASCYNAQHFLGTNITSFSSKKRIYAKLFTTYTTDLLPTVSIDENEISYQNMMQVLLTVMLVVSFSALLCSKCSTLLTQESDSPVPPKKAVVAKTI